MKTYSKKDENTKTTVVDIDGINEMLFRALDSKSERQLKRTISELVRGCGGDKHSVVFAASVAMDKGEMSGKELNKICKIMGLGNYKNALAGAEMTKMDVDSSSALISLINNALR